MQDRSGVPSPAQFRSMTLEQREQTLQHIVQQAHIERGQMAVVLLGRLADWFRRRATGWNDTPTKPNRLEGAFKRTRPAGASRS